MPNHYFTPQEPLANKQDSNTFTCAGRTFAYASGTGVFAKSGLDAGTRILLETALPLLEELPPGALLGDLGCGWGAVGCVLGSFFPQHNVLMNDVNPRAVALAAHNVRLNQLANAHAWCGDGLAAIARPTFHAILCNPPIRAGNAVIKRMMEDACRCLLPGGQLLVVIRTAQGAKSWQTRLKVLFGNCETLHIKSGYRILRSRMPLTQEQ